jgi:hypothetical protein
MILLIEGNKLQSWGRPLWNNAHTDFHQIRQKLSTSTCCKLPFLRRKSRLNKQTISGQVLDDLPFRDAPLSPHSKQLSPIQTHLPPKNNKANQFPKIKKQMQWEHFILTKISSNMFICSCWFWSSVYAPCKWGQRSLHQQGRSEYGVWVCLREG